MNSLQVLKLSKWENLIQVSSCETKISTNFIFLAMTQSHLPPFKIIPPCYIQIFYSCRSSIKLCPLQEHGMCPCIHRKISRDQDGPITCKERRKLFYLKTFKTGSTTVVNTLFRFAIQRDLKV